MHDNSLAIISNYLCTRRTSTFVSCEMSTQKSPANIFENSLNRFKIGLSDREKEDFELTSLDEVHGVVLKIQETHASELKMQNMNRLSSFLEGMEQYGSVIEVFLNASSFIAFVWVSSSSGYQRSPSSFACLRSFRAR